MNITEITEVIESARAQGMTLDGISIALKEALSSDEVVLLIERLSV